MMIMVVVLAGVCQMWWYGEGMGECVMAGGGGKGVGARGEGRWWKRRATVIGLAN